jgi:hypothetical protein
MDELLPGLYHWTAVHPVIRQPVSSYYVEPAAALIDPMAPAPVLDALRARSQPPQRILLTNRHHHRGSESFVGAFGCEVLCHEEGLHEFEGGPAVRGFSFGDEVAPGIVAQELDAICPEETALLIGHAGGVLSLGDALINWPDRGPHFVRDAYLGDDPEAVKDGIRAAVSRLVELEFESLLFAHGPPLIGVGNQPLRDFLER